MNKSVFPFSFWSLQCFQFNFFLLQFTTYKYGRMCRQIYVWHRSRINKESTTQYVYFFFWFIFCHHLDFLVSSFLQPPSHTHNIRLQSFLRCALRLAKLFTITSIVSSTCQLRIWHTSNISFGIRIQKICVMSLRLVCFALCEMFFRLIRWMLAFFFFASSKTPSISACVIRIYAVSWIIRWRIHCVFRFQGAHKWHRQQNIKPCNSQ